MYNIKIYNIKNIKSVVKNKKQKQNKKSRCFYLEGEKAGAETGEGSQLPTDPVAHR